MPNWYTNKIVIQGSKKYICNLWNQIHVREGLFCAISPEPKYLITQALLDKDSNKTGSPECPLRKWREKNWGTKWDINLNCENTKLHLEVNQDNTASLNGFFDTAYSPPIEVLEFLLKHAKKISEPEFFIDCVHSGESGKDIGRWTNQRYEWYYNDYNDEATDWSPEAKVLLDYQNETFAPNIESQVYRLNELFKW